MRIDLSAVVHNMNQVKELISPKTRIMGVVKSDAYGHGLLRVSQVLAKNGVHALGVAHLHEALELRKNGIRIPIVILCGIKSREESREVIDKDLTAVLYDIATVRLLAEEAARSGKKTNIQLKVDTGMGRLGIAHLEVGSYMKKIIAHRELTLEGLTSHLSSADEPQSHFTEAQIMNFKKAIETGHGMGLDLPLNNLANSAGVMNYEASHFNMVRPGIMLYGGLPSPEFRSPLPLKPVMSFRGQILQIRHLPDGTPVSYGRTYQTKGPQRIAILSAGYGDGLPRSMSNRGRVLIACKKVRVVGRVCMNMVMADITGLKDVKPGNEAVFLGSQGDGTITGDDMARYSGTISYEIFCSIGQRNVRKYVS